MEELVWIWYIKHQDTKIIIKKKCYKVKMMLMAAEMATAARNGALLSSYIMRKKVKLCSTFYKESDVKKR